MTLDDRDRRHRWAETCERLAKSADEQYARTVIGRPAIEAKSDAADLREIAAYLRSDEQCRQDHTPNEVTIAAMKAAELGEVEPSSAKEEG